MLRTNEENPHYQIQIPFIFINSVSVPVSGFKESQSLIPSSSGKDQTLTRTRLILGDPLADGWLGKDGREVGVRGE